MCLFYRLFLIDLSSIVRSRCLSPSPNLESDRLLGCAKRPPAYAHLRVRSAPDRDAIRESGLERDPASTWTPAPPAASLIARFAGWATGGCRRSRCSSSKPCRSSPAEGTTALAQCIATVSRSSKRSPSSSISPTGSVECPPAQGQQAVARRGGTVHRCAVGNPITRAPNRIGSTAECPRLGRQRT